MTTYRNSLLVRVVAVFCVCFLLIMAVEWLIPGAEAEIYDSVIRLHVLANSDSEADQQVKLAVRDALLAECGALFASAENREDARVIIDENLPRLREIADRVLEEQGFPYRSRIVIGSEKYPTREYDGVAFPAGEYLSLRVLLGAHEGQNWWCVLFPPLCMRASTAKSSLESAGIDSATGQVYTKGRFSFRFKLLEFLFG